MDTMPVVTIIDRVGPVVRLSEAAAAAVATSPEQILLAWFAQMTPTRRRLVQRVLTHFAKWSTDDQAAGPRACQPARHLGEAGTRAIEGEGVGCRDSS